MCLTLMVLGDKHKNKQKRIYSLSLADLYGKEHMIQAIGLDSLTEVESAPKVMKLKLVNRPQRKVNIMLGMASKSLHCKKGLKAGDLRLNKPVFSPVWVITGVGGGVKGRHKKKRLFFGHCPKVASTPPPSFWTPVR